MRVAKWQLAFLLLLSVTAVACAQLGLVQPQTTPEKLAVAYGTVTQVRIQAAALLKQKLISADEGNQILEITNLARKALDAAQKQHFSGDERGATDGLKLVSAMLEDAQEFLKAREKRKSAPKGAKVT